MKYFLIALAVVAVILLIIFWKRIAAFFGWGPMAEGAGCTDSNGNTSIIENGVCKEVVIPNPPDETVRYIVPQYPAYYQDSQPFYGPGFRRPGSVLIY